MSNLVESTAICIHPQPHLIFPVLPFSYLKALPSQAPAFVGIFAFGPSHPALA